MERSRAIPAARRPAPAPPPRRGYGPLHVGTDIGGSVRLPAGWCGLFGLKPSGGRVPIDPPYHGRVAGPLTRTVADAALMMATLSRPDARDFTSLPPQALDWRVTPTALARAQGRVAAGGRLRRPAEADGRARRSSARRATSRPPGAIVEPLAPFLTQEMLDGLDRFWRMRSLTRPQRAAARKARQGAAVHPRLGGVGRRA